MKNVIAKGFMTGALLVMAIMAAGVSAHAQTLQYKLTANIPFEFTVSKEKLPAGKYSVGRAHDSSGDTVLQIRSDDGDRIVTRFSVPIVTFNPKNGAELVFHRYGDQYFLSEIWPAGGGTGRALPKSHEERELERNARVNQVAGVKAPKAEIVTVVAGQQ